MAQQSLPLPSGGFHPGRPPIPREHGAWVMLYAPLIVGLGAAQPLEALPALLLVLAVTGAFLAQNAAGLLIKPRPKPGTAFWLVVFTALFAASGLGLLVGYGLTALWWIALAAGALFGVHAFLLKGPAIFRMDRFQWSQLLAVGGLALTAPAAFAVATGTLSATAWWVWAGCMVYFGSGVFNVNMHFAAAKHKGELDGSGKWLAARDNVLYHVLGAAALVAAMTQVPLISAALLLVGAAPVLARAVWSTLKLTKKLPSLKAVGMRETGFAAWFALCLVAAITLL